MSGETQLKASDRLAEHIKSIDEYVAMANVSYSAFNVEYIVASNLTADDMSKMTSQEMFDSAYLLYGYSTYIQDEINKNKIALSWCNDQIEKLVAASVDNMRLVAESRLQTLEGKTYELKRQADILLERAKRS